jgi:hypothetical protein
MVTATLVLTSLLSFNNLPAYKIADGDTWKFNVKAKAEIQPYTYGGTLTVGFKSKGQLWDMTINHKVMFEANGEKGPGPEQVSVWEVQPTLYPTGTGEGANTFGDQLMGILFMPDKAQVQCSILASNAVFNTTSATENEMLKVTSKIEHPTGQHTIDRWLDPKTLKLVKAKCVTKNATGLITYELTPIK